MSRFTLIFFSLLSMTTSLIAKDPIVFVSAFSSGDEGAIHSFQFNSKTGELKPLKRTTDVEHPFFLAVSENGKHLYSIDTKEFSGKENEFVAAFLIDRATGELKKLNRESSLGTASCYLDIDSTGQTVVVANYTTGSVAALFVKPDGSLQPATAFIQHKGASVNPQRQMEPHAHCIEISPDNQFALVADLGIDKILVYRLDAETGTLAAHEKQSFVTVPPGSGPRHVTFHPDGKKVYVINELKNTISFFAYQPEQGLLKLRQTIPTLPNGFTGTSHCADLKVTPNGKYLYGTNRGHDSVAMYRISIDGTLELIGIEPSLGKGPQNLFITPDGNWLLCANMPGNNLIVFQIEQSTGQLQPHGEPTSIPMPSCIRWLD